MTKSGSTHTPGPWHTGGKGNSIVYAEYNGYAVADARVYHPHIDEPTMQVNARLIAKAPELYNLLSLLAQKYTSPDTTINEWKDTAAVVAKLARPILAEIDGGSDVKG